MLTEERLPAWASGHRVLGVGGQTGRPVDDVGAVTDGEGWVMVQAKKGLNLSSSPVSAFAKALGQLVDAVAVGVPDRPPLQDTRRRIDASVDRVLVLADDRAPKTVRVALAKVTDRLAGWPEGVPLDEVATNKDEREALSALREHLNRLWRDRHGTDLDEAMLRRVVRPLRVRAIHLREGGQDYQAVRIMLADLVQDQNQAGKLWAALETLCQGMADDQLWMDREALVAALEGEGFHLRAPTRLRLDIQRLRRLSMQNIQSLSAEITLTTPDGPIALARSVEPLLAAVGGNVAVTGGPGTGKSALLSAYAKDVGREADLVMLQAEDLRGSAGQTRGELNLQHDLVEVLHGWPGPRPGVLLLDGLDQTRGADASGWLSQLACRLEGTRWRIVASIRSFDLRHGHRWSAMFRGEPVNPQHADPELGEVRHLLVEDLSEEELTPLLAASPSMAALVEAADARLRQLMANPFNIDIAGQLLTAGKLADLGLVADRIDLLDKYWEYRVTGDDGNGYDRTCALRATVDRMIGDRRQQVGDPATLALDGAARTALRDLIRNGVLRELPRKPGYPNAPVALAHPVLFDYAVAVLALGDVTVADSLADRLDEDPNLSMVVRPSLDYRLGIAWRTDPSRDSFWQLALRLASSTSGHDLAAAAAASVAAAHLETADELEPLAGACIDAGSRTGSSWSVLDARRLMFLVATAIGFPAAANPAALEAIGAVTAGLADHAQSHDDVDLAVLAAQLLGRALAAGEPDPATPTAHDWARTAAACMTIALHGPQDAHRKQLADISGRILAVAAVLDPAVTSTAVSAAISRPALEAWGTSVVQRLIDRLPDIARQAPDLAVEIGASVWEFDETSNETTSITDSRILSLTSTRSQDLDSARHGVGTEFPALAAVDAEAAARLLLRVVEAPRMFRWDRSTPSSSRPRVRFGDTLRYSGGHDAALTMAVALIDVLDKLAHHAEPESLAAADPGAVDPPPAGTVLRRVIALMIDGLTHCEVWQLLLYRAVTAEGPTLALALTPALTSEALFSSSETCIAAGHLAARLSKLVSQDEHVAIEAAILDATGPVVASNSDDPEWTAQAGARRRERRDMFLAALEPDKIGNPRVRQHLAELTASGGPRPVLPALSEPDRAPTGTWEPEPAGSRASEGPLNAAVKEVTEVLQRLTDDDHAIRDQARQQLMISWPRLHTELTAARGGVDEPQRAHQTLLEGALQLARTREVSTNTDLGAQLLATLVAACPSAATPSANDAVNGDWRGAYGVTPTTTALQALAALLRRPDWRAAHGEQLRRLLRPHLDSRNPVYRLLSLEVITAIFEEPGELRAELEHRLITETDKHNLTPLIVTAANCYLHSEPATMDQILQKIAGTPQWAVLAEDSAGDDSLGGNDHTHQAVGVLTILAAAYATAYASRTAQTWLSHPTDHPDRASRACSWLRQHLNPADPALEQAQERAFALLALPLEQAHAVWEQITQTSTAGERLRDDARNVAIVAHHATQQLYFASGANDDTKPPASRPGRGNLDRFADLAVPLLEGYGDIHHPAVTHHVIQTLDHISPTQPRAVLLAAVRAAADDNAYAQEPLAVDAVLQLIKRYLADHRNLVLGDPECTTAVRKLLESFVRVGWNQAIQMAESMDEMFR
jgi:hypothetical protein